VQQIKSQLHANNFQGLCPQEKWKLKSGGKYYVTLNQSACIAFIIGEGAVEKHGFKIIGTHTDHPALRIKPQPEMIQQGYLKLNTEVYGGPILNTWLDRPLALAGRVSIKSDHPLWPKTRLININKPLLIIPNQAIHINPKVNEGVPLNRQRDMLPLIKMVEKDFRKDNYLLELLEKELQVSIEDILDFDLFLYDYQRGNLIGIDDEFISTGRMDDLAMVHAGVKALCRAKPASGINVLACFDNEEIGSSTKQGADSPLLAHTLERIILSLHKDKNVLSNREDYFRALANSFFISADMAHAVHPNNPEKHDPTNKPIINGGPVIKINANQRYTTDSESAAVFKRLCRDHNIPVQQFVNRSDERGGSTIGPISATHVNVRSIDIGNPLLAMHSIRELGGVMDHQHITDAFTAFYSL
jgi:aspartyl aminopeptidase